MAKASITVINLLCLLVLCRATESPQYEVVHVESDFEIRHYRGATWMSATVNDLSFQRATLFGFHRLFQFIQGANLNFSRVAMTSPVVTSLIPGAGPLHSSAYVIRFYLPAKFQDSPPTPLPELNLRPYTWDSHFVAVRKFSGFATDDTVVKEAEKLGTSLSLSPWANSTTSTDYAYSIAQYDPPFHLFSRLNEVWVDVDASIFAGKATF
ncbi:putative apyrase 7-like isoform X1 [Hibiscus syriacus]|uniref:Apyrase 7-like isoform X1 n=1 Tax=Hibiscus syriacus TaxID=106335 RepID=A0A6A3AR13_HIBSY|nr:heme-binding protein 2-like [Hibiscus syriacus]KAE8705349.1 putative apyrase 7-like isoform X1 [Hibiscus syriacus]